MSATTKLAARERDALEALSHHGSLTSEDLSDILTYAGWGVSHKTATSIARNLIRAGLAEIATSHPSYAITEAGRASLTAPAKGNAR